MKLINEIKLPIELITSLFDNKEEADQIFKDLYFDDIDQQTFNDQGIKVLPSMYKDINSNINEQIVIDDDIDILLSTLIKLIIVLLITKL